jgi:PEGA domain-containing protein
MQSSWLGRRAPHPLQRASCIVTGGMAAALWALPVAARSDTPAGAAAPAPSAAPSPAASPTPSAPSEQPGELNVREQSEQASIYVDDELVGTGTFRGKVAPGRHRLRVTQPGFQSYETLVEVLPGQVHTETVALRQSVLGQAGVSSWTETPEADGLYGGVQLFAAFQPSGSGTTFEDACDTTGATSCDPGSPIGGGLAGYIGWMFTPLGLELALLLSGDVVQPEATFDGVTGSEINPILAAPARVESFNIGRVGGGAVLRARFTYAVSRFRLTAAAGPGLAYRYLALTRDTEAADGSTSEVASTGASYVSPMLSLEVAGQLRLGSKTALALGIVSWFEHAGDDVKSEARNNTVLFSPAGVPVAPQATPEYDMANGPQWFIGPFLGLAFGP